MQPQDRPTHCWYCKEAYLHNEGQLDETETDIIHHLCLCAHCKTAKTKEPLCDTCIKLSEEELSFQCPMCNLKGLKLVAHCPGVWVDEWVLSCEKCRALSNRSFHLGSLRGWLDGDKKYYGIQPARDCLAECLWMSKMEYAGVDDNGFCINLRQRAYMERHGITDLMALPRTTDEIEALLAEDERLLEKMKSDGQRTLSGGGIQ